MEVDARPRTQLLAAHLTRSGNLHGGNFRYNTSLLSRAVTWEHTLRARRPRIGAVRLTIVHDEESLESSHGAAVDMHRLDPASLAAPSSVAPNDLRWLAYERLLDAPDEQNGIGPEDCLVAIDVGDVGIIGNATALCANYPRALFAASDACGVGGARGVKAWLRGQALKANFSLTSAPLLHTFLSMRTLVPIVFNCGVTGGSRSVFVPFVRAMASAIRAHHAQHPVAGQLIDMLVFNELVLRRLAADSTETLLRGPRDALGWNRSVVTGWPLGTLNLPMFGFFCGQDPCTISSRNATPRRHCSVCGHCLSRHVLSIAPAYQFAHKVPYLHHPCPLPQCAWTGAY